MCTTMMACRLWMYSLVDHSLSTSRDSSTVVHSHPPSPSCWYVFLAIRLSTRLLKLSRTVNVSPITTHLSLPYIKTVCITSFSVISHNCTTGPAFVGTFSTILHCRHVFLRLWYKASQSLLSYETVCPRYGKASLGSIGTVFTLMTTLLSSKKCWRVSRRLRFSSPIKNLTDS